MQQQQITRGDVAKQWLMRSAKRLAIASAIAIPLLLGVRAVVAEEFHAKTNAVAPEIPRDARVLVYKLTSSFKPHDIIVYRNQAGTAFLGRVISADAAGLTVSRTGEANAVVPMHQVVGRVVLSTR